MLITIRTCLYRFYGVRMNKEEARQALGQRIRSLRQERKHSVRGFALMVGLSKDYIVDIEHGRKSPTLDTLIKVSSGLDVPLSQLLDGIGESGEVDQDDAPDKKFERPNSGPSVNYHATRF